MRGSRSYILGALDALVKAGEVSPSYAAGAASVLVKDAGFFSDTPAENIVQQWGDMADKPGFRDRQTGLVNMNGEQAKQLIDRARPWYDNMGGRIGANMRYFGRGIKGMLPEWMTGRQMSSEENRRMLEYDRNKMRQAYLDRAGGAAPAALYGAFQDAAVRDARYAYRDQGRYKSPAEMKAVFGEDEEAAANRFRTSEGMAAMRNGLYRPEYDKQSAKTPTPSVQNASTSFLYGGKNRTKLYSQAFRNGLGMY